MSGWLNNLKNLQGHLTDLASEVLNEATEEVADPESELQVTRKRCAELEEHLKEAEAKREAAENQKSELEERLRATHFEMDSIGSRYGDLIAARDEELKRVNIELEQARAALHDEDVLDVEMREEKIDNLKKEVAHWKSLVVQGGSNASAELIRRQKDQEVAALIEMHEEKVQELKDHYEEKLAAHMTSAGVSSSESSEAMLDAVLLEKEELMEEKRRLEEQLSRMERHEDEEKAVLVDVAEREEGSLSGKLTEAEEEIERLRRELDELKNKEVEMEQLRLVNNELTSAYNDLNGELEQLKQREGRAANSNRDLMMRIDALKADVIEYEERYELCKRENADTLKQLEKLTADFNRLRKVMDEARHRADQSDITLAAEVDKLRIALGQSKEDRDKLRDDVEKFKTSIETIDSELQELRDVNNRLMEDNGTLSGQLDKCHESMSVKLEMSDKNLNAFRDELDDMSKLMKEQCTAFEEKERMLNEQIEILQAELRLKELQKAVVDMERSTGTSADTGRKTENEGDSRASEDDEESRLVSHLREALAANTEVTEENERIRVEKEELEKELQIRQACIDEMIQQSSVLQAAQQQAANTVAALRKEIVEKEKELREAEVRAVHHTEEIALIEAELEMLKMQISENSEKQQKEESESEEGEMDGKKERVEIEIEELRRRVEEAVREREEETRRREKAEREREGEKRRREICESQAASVAALEEEVNQLKGIAMQKHEESVAYYAQAQGASAELQRLQAQVEDMPKQLQIEVEKKEKAEKELARLTQHLVIVEESSVVEAMEAEQRETRLIERVRSLEASQSATMTSAEETTHNSQARISALEKALRAAETEARENRERAERIEKERKEAAEALASLQEVVRDLANEHDRDAAHAGHQVMTLKDQFKEAQKAIAELEDERERLLMDRQAAEDGVAVMKGMMEGKERVIEELEIRLEEAHSAASMKANAAASQYRIDDGTLRQLFLSYFLSPSDRRADIALLLASILEYPSEEMDKIKTAIKSTMGKGSGQTMGGGGSSITEQFIRFLETESESSRTAPQLPVRTERSAISGDDIRSTVQAAASDSSSMLRDLFSAPSLSIGTPAPRPLPLSAQQQPQQPDATSQATSPTNP